MCAQRIQSGQQAPPVASLGKAVLYGVGAALAGCALYALVAIVTGWEVGLVAILVGLWWAGRFGTARADWAAVRSRYWQ
jgi:hypothetical protein